MHRPYNKSFYQILHDARLRYSVIALLSFLFLVQERRRKRVIQERRSVLDGQLPFQESPISQTTWDTHL